MKSHSENGHTETGHSEVKAAEKRTNDKPEIDTAELDKSVLVLSKRKIKMPDGRYMIFYSDVELPSDKGSDNV